MFFIQINYFLKSFTATFSFVNWVKFTSRKLLEIFFIAWGEGGTWVWCFVDKVFFSFTWLELTLMIFLLLFFSSSSAWRKKIRNMVSDMRRNFMLVGSYVPRRLLLAAIVYQYSGLLRDRAPVRSSHFGEFQPFYNIAIWGFGKPWKNHRHKSFLVI